MTGSKTCETEASSTNSSLSLGTSSKLSWDRDKLREGSTNNCSMIAWFVEKFSTLKQFSPSVSVAPWALPVFSAGVIGAL